MFKKFLFALIATFILTGVASAQVNTAPSDKLVLDTTKGKIVIALRPDLAPNHVAQIKKLTQQGFYNGVPFHRVVDGFYGADRGTRPAPAWVIQIYRI